MTYLQRTCHAFSRANDHHHAIRYGRESAPDRRRRRVCLASEVVREALRDWTRNRDTERRELETLRDAIKAGLDSGPGIPADEVFAELRVRYANKS